MSRRQCCSNMKMNCNCFDVVSLHKHHILGNQTANWLANDGSFYIIQHKVAKPQIVLHVKELLIVHMSYQIESKTTYKYVAIVQNIIAKLIFITKHVHTTATMSKPLQLERAGASRNSVVNIAVMHGHEKVSDYLNTFLLFRKRNKIVRRITSKCMETENTTDRATRHQG